MSLLVCGSAAPDIPAGYHSDSKAVHVTGPHGASSLEGHLVLAWTSSPDAAADVMARAEAARVYAADAKLRVEHQKAMGVDEGAWLYCVRCASGFGAPLH
jgi:hypothetical protein